MPITTSSTPEGWSPNVTAFVADEAVPDALVLQTSQVVGSVEGDAPAVNVPWVSDDGTSGFVDEGAPISENEGTYTQTQIFTRKVATLGQFSREQLAQPNAAQLITNSMSRSLTAHANTAYLQSLTNPTGLLNVAGVHDGGAIGDDLDALVDALTHIESAGGQGTHLIAHPSAWGYLQSLKTGADSASPLVGAGVHDAPDRRLLGVPVLTTPAMPVGGLLVLDSTQVVSAVGQVLVARSDDAYFASDNVGIRLTFRFGFNVMRPNRIVRLTAGDTEPVDESSSSS